MVFDVIECSVSTYTVIESMSLHMIMTSPRENTECVENCAQYF